MTHRFEIAGTGHDYLRFEVDGYENPKATDTNDANWLACSVELRSEGFAGIQRCALMTYDFASLSKGLNELVYGAAETASFVTDEGWVEFEIRKARTGVIQVSGKLRGGAELRMELVFTLDTMLSALEVALAELAAVLAAFPVRS